MSLCSKDFPDEPVCRTQFLSRKRPKTSAHTAMLETIFTTLTNDIVEKEQHGRMECYGIPLHPSCLDPVLSSLRQVQGHWKSTVVFV